MHRVLIAALGFASVCLGQEFSPTADQISQHREQVFAYARDYVVDTFNLQVLDEGDFNPVRFNSQGVWGTFEARMKELGGDRFEVRGWVMAVGQPSGKIPWSVVVRYPLEDPESWRYRRVDDTAVAKPEYLGWKFGDYHSIGYTADYTEEFIAKIFTREGSR